MEATAEHTTGAEGTEQINAGTFEAAKAKAAKAGGNVEVQDNGNGTYTVSGKFEDGNTWSKTFVDTDGSSHAVGNPDADYVAKVKASMSDGLAEGDTLGQDANADGQYKGRDLNTLGSGARSKLMKDRIMLELINKGYSHESADNIARSQMKAHALKKYGADQLEKWAQEGRAKA